MMRHNRSLAAAVVLSVLLPLGLAGTAHAAIDVNVLLTKCGDGADCEFNLIVPSNDKQEIIPGTPKTVGQSVNCTKSNSNYEVKMETTDVTGGSVENSVGGSVSLQLGKEGVAAATFTASYEHRWGTSWQLSKGFSLTKQILVPSKHKGWFVRTPSLRRATGTYVLRFKEPFQGRFFHVVEGVTLTGPDPTGEKQVIVAKTARLTADEEKRLCDD